MFPIKTTSCSLTPKWLNERYSIASPSPGYIAFYVGLKSSKW